MSTTMMNLARGDLALAENRGLLAPRWVVPVLGVVEDGSVRWRGGFRPAQVAPRLPVPRSTRWSPYTLTNDDGDVIYDDQAYAVFADEDAR
ncbi:MAG: hypothetical protein ABIJ09_21705 [Pseudomonadota bacterium]